MDVYPAGLRKAVASMAIQICDGSRGQRHTLIARRAPRAMEQPQASDFWSQLRAFDVVVVPGLDGSGPEHWQSHWVQLLSRFGISVKRVEQRDWALPEFSEWRAGLMRTLDTCKRPVLVVAHSLGAILTTKIENIAIAGALLVAPADVERASAVDLPRVSDFKPLSQSRMPFPSVVVASLNDPWLSFPRACELADTWSSHLVSAGRAGHLGSQDRIGSWIGGLDALEHLLMLVEAQKIV